MTPIRASRTWFDRYGLWLFALLALAPLVWCLPAFMDLFWLADEWDQFDQIAKVGFWPWAFGFFGENLAPLFKLSWGTMVFAGGGSYFVFVATLWLAHATCVGLLGWWMREAGFGSIACAVAMVGLGLAPSNVETLGWPVNLITVQGMLFFLLAARWHTARENDGAWDFRSLAILGTLVTLSTFSFARGVLTGGSLAAATLLSLLPGRGPWRNWRTRMKIVAVCLVPALTLTALIVLFAEGNHRQLAESGLAAPATFAAWNFLLNPFHRLVDVSTWGPYTTVVLGMFKITLLVAGWRVATSGQKRVLLTLLVFEIGSAALLGIGRFHTGLTSTIDSRYQYVSLLCTLPFAGVCVDAFLRAMCRHRWIRDLAAASLLLALALGAIRAWPGKIQPWADQGRRTREMLTGRAPLPPGVNVTGVDWIDNERAAELVKTFNLH